MEKNERPQIPSDLFLGMQLQRHRHPQRVPPHGGVVRIAVVGRRDLRSHAHGKEASLGQRSRLPARSETWAELGAFDEENGGLMGFNGI